MYSMCAGEGKEALDRFTDFLSTFPPEPCKHVKIMPMEQFLLSAGKTMRSSPSPEHAEMMRTLIRHQNAYCTDNQFKVKD